MKKGVIYARYSSAAQNESSIEQQLIVCYEYAKKNDISIVGEYIDKAMTGRNDERPDFQRMLKDATKKQWEYVIVYKLDRFSRNRYDSAIHNKTLKKYGIKRLSATENISDAPEGILMESVLEGMAEYYSIELAQKINRGLDDNVRKGLMVGGSVTWGYKLSNKRLEIDDDTAIHVRYIYNAYAQGKTMDDIIEDLTSRGIFNSNGKSFQHQHISKILHNKRYIGIFTYKGVEHPDFIPPIIDINLFNEVQDKLLSYKNYGKKKSEFNFVLTGKLTCGHCGKPMCGITAKNRHNVRYGYYICRTGCQREKKIHLEELVASVISQTLLEPNHRDELIDNLVDQANKMDLVVAQEIDVLRHQVTSVKRKLSNLIKAVQQGIISPTLQNELRDNEMMIEKLNLEISKKKQTRQVDVDTDKLNFFLEQLYKKRNTKDGVEFIIKTFVKNVTLWDDKMTVHFDVTGKSPLDKTVEFNDLGVIKSASHLHQLTRYNNPIGYQSPKVYVYGYHIFITIHRITKKVA